MEYPNPDELTEEQFDNIFEALYQEQSGEKLKVLPVCIVWHQKQDQLGLQCIAGGTYYGADGYEWFNFTIEDGIDRGSVVLETMPWDASNSEPEPIATIYRFQPKAVTPFSMKKLEFNTHIQEQERKMSYDLSFSPTSETRRYWQEYADKISAEIITITGTSEELHDWDKNRFSKEVA